MVAIYEAPSLESNTKSLSRRSRDFYDKHPNVSDKHIYKFTQPGSLHQAYEFTQPSSFRQACEFTQPGSFRQACEFTQPGSIRQAYEFTQPGSRLQRYVEYSIRTSTATPIRAKRTQYRENTWEKEHLHSVFFKTDV